MAYKKEGEDDASKEEPLSDLKRDVNATVCLVLRATVENGVGPGGGR